MTLPPLPTPGVSQGVAYYFPTYTKNQMSEYGQACADAERERCAKICEERAYAENDVQWCLDRIRSKT